jgi:WhiB family redox-sensing transcriptional regulator
MAVALMVVRQSWYERAACLEADADSFFPEKGGSSRPAKRVCSACIVRTECLAYALENDERFGIWGGMSERERRQLKRGIREPDTAVRPAC